jgi:archaellum biogenesis ATPase FlaH
MEPENSASTQLKPGLRLDGASSQIIVLIMPEENYTGHLLDVLSDMARSDWSILYVSLNRPYSSMIKIFGEKGISPSRMHFVDAITKTAEIPGECDQCDYVSSPGSLTELSVNISRLLDNGQYNLLIFDSLSTLLVYESDTTIAKFVHFLMAKVRVAGCSALFTCLKQDSDSILIKDINMFADKVIDFEKWNLG